jgi:hypothetical protein
VNVRDLNEGDFALGWDGDMQEARAGDVEYTWGCFHAQVWPGQRRHVAYVPVLISERPGSGMLDGFLDELSAAVRPRELVFVNVINARLEAHLTRLGYRCLCPEDAFQDDGSEGLIARQEMCS